MNFSRTSRRDHLTRNLCSPSLIRLQSHLRKNIIADNVSQGHLIPPIHLSPLSPRSTSSTTPSTSTSKPEPLNLCIEPLYRRQTTTTKGSSDRPKLLSHHLTPDRTATRLRPRLLHQPFPPPFVPLLSPTLPLLSSILIRPRNRLPRPLQRRQILPPQRPIQQRVRQTQEPLQRFLQTRPHALDERVWDWGRDGRGRGVGQGEARVELGATSSAAIGWEGE